MRDRLEHYIKAYRLNNCKVVELPIGTLFKVLESCPRQGKSIIAVSGSVYSVETMELY